MGEGEKEEKRVERDWERYNDMAEARGGRLPTVFELRESALLHAEGLADKCWVPVEFCGAEGSTATVRISGVGPLSGGCGVEMPAPGSAAWARIEKKHGRRVVMVVKPRIPKESQAPVRFVVARGAVKVMQAVGVAPQCTVPIAD